MSNKTDSNVRQVYFPVDSKDGYYIITPLPSSSVLHRFSTLLKKNNEYNKNPDSSTSLKADTMETKGLYLDGGYWKLPGLVSISYGGDKPQNVSDDNLRIGRHQLMKCLPPKIRRRSITIPQWSFFTESVFSKESRYKELFVALDRIYKCPRNNMDIRNTRDEYLLTLLEEISTDIASVRYEISFKKGPYKGSLDPAEYMMLYEDEKRYESDEWLRAMCEKFAKWFFDTYKKSVKKPFEFGEGEFHVVRDFAFDNKEVFIA